MPMTLGLSTERARTRLVETGPNELRRAATTPVWQQVLRQFASPLVVLLLAACAVSALLGEVADAIAIGVIVVVNALVGYLQEARAERALQALRGMTAPRARVMRDGRLAMIAAAEVVAGDLLVLEAGDVVAADAQLTEAHALEANEAPLTGESAPVEKKVGLSKDGAALAEKFDRVFMGTSVTRGTGLAEVIATGMGTELGRVAHLLDTANDEETPLQKRLRRVGHMLIISCGAVVVVTSLLGLARGVPPVEVFMMAVSLAVAAVPEGLPAVVTIALAVGVQRLAARNVLVRRLPAVETLGSATVICTDKTGTLTTGVMVVREVWGPDHDMVLAAAAACCDAELSKDAQGGTGDPTEVAILAGAFRRGITKESIESDKPRRTVHPFDTERRMMSIFRADGHLYAKGAFESIAAISRGPMGEAEQVSAGMAERGLRVLAISVGESDQEQNLRLIGLLGIADPPRTEAIEAVAAARGAGIRTVVITGDHPRTAQAIAKEMGIILPGDDPDKVVHARATPEDKLRIVRGLKADGQVVAMTGDGVNDAPALREAHIGVAMGKTGTEVTREAADMVLADDNFASIVAAVREGRGIFDNIRKTLVYLLAGNVGEMLLMLGAAAAGMPAPLLPLHLLWINLVTDGLPALALVVDPADPDVMKRPPRAPSEPMLGLREWRGIIVTGALQASVALAVFVWALRSRDLGEARNLAFTTMVFGELFRAFASRSDSRVVWELGLFTNVRLVLVVVASGLIQIGIHHIAALEALFKIKPLSLADCALSIGLGLIPVTLVELTKLVRRLPQGILQNRGTAS